MSKGMLAYANVRAPTSMSPFSLMCVPYSCLLAHTTTGQKGKRINDLSPPFANGITLRNMYSYDCM
jgi:hypothetical protein